MTQSTLVNGGLKAILVQSAYEEGGKVVDAQGSCSGECRENSQGSLFVLHLLQDGHDHVEFWPLGRILIHADPHKFANVGRDARRDGGTQTL